MNKFASALALAVIVSVIAVSPATAGSATDALSTCMADNTTGKDRKDLARWIFVTMATHPEIQRFSNITEANRDELDKALAAMVTKLVTESCRTEAKVAIEEGGASFEAAFEVIGKLAMQELMSNPSVNSSFTRYTKFLDKAKFNSALSNK